MDGTHPAAIQTHFRKLRDPRLRRRRRHELVPLVVMAICAVIGDCDTWEDIGMFARKRCDWFARFLHLPNGVPSADTFARVFSLLDPAAFGACFQSWIKTLSESLQLKHIAIDGKSLRGSSNRVKGLGALHIVSAWATEQHLSLGQVAVDAKSNEITAIPALLELLELKGALVTIDAMGCQKEIAAKVVARGGDYVLTVKDNQPHLLDDIQETIGQALEGELPAEKMTEHTTTTSSHGRTEKRTYIVVDELKDIRDKELWSKLTSVGMCIREQTIQGVTTSEVSYFIGSRQMNAKRFGKALRCHWGIENNLHWQLDVTFSEDASRVQDRNAAQNFTWLRRMALSLLKRHPGKTSIRSKRKEAAIDPDFLKEIVCPNAKMDNG